MVWVYTITTQQQQQSFIRTRWGRLRGSHDVIELCRKSYLMIYGMGISKFEKWIVAVLVKQPDKTAGLIEHIGINWGRFEG